VKNNKYQRKLKKKFLQIFKLAL